MATITITYLDGSERPIINASTLMLTLDNHGYKDDRGRTDLLQVKFDGASVATLVVKLAAANLSAQTLTLPSSSQDALACKWSSSGGKVTMTIDPPQGAAIGTLYGSGKSIELVVAH